MNSLFTLIQIHYLGMTVAVMISKEKQEHKNGSGADGDGITKDRRTGRWHCFKCGFHGTNIDLIGVYFGITDNAAMIACTGYFKYLDNDFCGIDVPIYSNTRL